MADYSSLLPISLFVNLGTSYIPNYCAILPVGDTNNTTMTLTIVSVRNLGELNPLILEWAWTGLTKATHLMKVSLKPG